MLQTARTVPPQAAAARADTASPESASRAHFAELLGAEWWRLPLPIRRRFSTAAGDVRRHVVYRGIVAHTRLTRLGRLFSQLSRLIGAPLPLDGGERAAVTVVVAPGGDGQCQHWTRIYAREHGAPQIIRSTKRFAGATGLQELVGCGFGMDLVMSVEQRALVFRSAGYFLEVGRLRLRVPEWLTPGEIEVVHREARAGRFSFALRVLHPRAGCIIEQLAFFTDGHSP